MAEEVGPLGIIVSSPVIVLSPVPDELSDIVAVVSLFFIPQKVVAAVSHSSSVLKRF